MIKLCGAPASVFVRKVKVLLLEKNIPFVVEPISPLEELSEEFLAISPLGKIPAIVDGDFAISDSSVICSYLERKYPTPALYPQSSELLAKALWFEEYADTALFSALAPIFYQTYLVPLFQHKLADSAVIDEAWTHNVPKVAEYLVAQLQDRDFLVGDQFSMADIAVVSQFYNLLCCDFTLDKWPSLEKYVNAILQRSSFQQCQVDMEQLKGLLDSATVT